MTSPVEHPVHDDPRMLLVQRLLASRSFEKSGRLREFLAYICEHSLDESQPGIHEQEIGCAVFYRPAGYDTNQDNIVRVNASQLRKRLKTYFETDGASEDLWLELPKGQYKPVFHRRAEPVPVSLDMTGENHRPGGRRMVAWLAALSVVLAVLCLALTVALLHTKPVSASPSIVKAASNALWPRFFGNDLDTGIVLSDSSLGLVQDLTGRPVPLSEYIHPGLWLPAPQSSGAVPAQAAARLAGKRRYTDMSSVNAARRILASAGGAGESRITMYFAREFSLQQMKSGNTVLLGSRRTNPWVELAENRMSFHFGFDRVTRQAYFENKQPLAGELPTYGNDRSVSYCQIAFLPDSGGVGNILVISGTDPEGTETGAEFLTTATGIETLQRRVAGNRTDPMPYFDLVLKSPRIGGAAGSSEIVAARLLKANQTKAREF